MDNPEYFQVGLRSIFILLALFTITKLLGKKQLSKLSFFEYITGITIGSIAGTLSMDLELKLIEGLMSILLWFMVPFLFSLISLKSIRFRHFVEGKPTVFIDNGKLNEKAMKKEKYSIDELIEQLHKKSIFRIEDIEYASLDSNGDLSVLLKKEKQPLTREDFFGVEKKATVPQTIINDGVIMESVLETLGYSKEWLSEEITKRGLKIKEIFLAQLDKDGNLTFDLYDWSPKQRL